MYAVSFHQYNHLQIETTNSLTITQVMGRASSGGRPSTNSVGSVSRSTSALLGGQYMPVTMQSPSIT